MGRVTNPLRCLNFGCKHPFLNCKICSSCWPDHCILFRSVNCPNYTQCLYITVRSCFEIFRNFQKSKLNKTSILCHFGLSDWTDVFALAFGQGAGGLGHE